MGTFNRRIAAKIVANALTMGHQEAAKLGKVSVKTVGRYVLRVETDEKLAALVHAEGQKAERIAGPKRRRALEIVEQRLLELVQMADDPEHIQAVTAAYVALRDADLTAKFLNVSVGANSEGSEAAEASGEPSEGEDSDRRESEAAGH